MKPRSVTYTPTETGALAWHPWRRSDGQKTMQVILSPGASLTYKIQHTAGDLQDGSTVTAVDDADATGKTAGDLYHFDKLVSGSRINVTTFGSGTITVVYLEERTY